MQNFSWATWKGSSPSVREMILLDKNWATLGFQLFMLTPRHHLGTPGMSWDNKYLSPDLLHLVHCILEYSRRQGELICNQWNTEQPKAHTHCSMIAEEPKELHLLHLPNQPRKLFWRVLQLNYAQADFLQYHIYIICHLFIGSLWVHIIFWREMNKLIETYCYKRLFVQFLTSIVLCLWLKLDSLLLNNIFVVSIALHSLSYLEIQICYYLGHQSSN